MTNLISRGLVLILIHNIYHNNICVDAHYRAKGGINKVPKALSEHVFKSPRSGKSMPNPKVYRCGDLGKDRVVNFVNQNYPDDDVQTGDCIFRLVIMSHDICQIRVDFVDTELMDPVRGQCLSQFFLVEGAIWPTGLPPLCGINSDQHYERFTLRPSLCSGGLPIYGRALNALVEPFKRLKDLTHWILIFLAPEGCTQYFLSESGAIRSFNYEGYRYLNGLSYQVCIRPGKGVCGIRYDSAPGDFGMKKSILGSREMHIRSGVGASVCGTDFILIPDARDSILSIREGRLLFQRKRRPPVVATAKPIVPTKRKPEVRLSQDRFCGGNLSPAGGEAINKPIFARVRSNLISLHVKTSPLQEFRGKIEALNLTSGFRLAYSQIRGCEDNETEMVQPPQLTNLVQAFHLQAFGDYVYPLSREPEPSDSTVSSSSVYLKTSNATGNNSTNSKDFDSDDDKFWDYLDAETDDDDDNDETELYDEYD